MKRENKKLADEKEQRRLEQQGRENKLDEIINSNPPFKYYAYFEWCPRGPGDWVILWV